MPLPTASNVTRPRALGYGALLGDLYLRLAPSASNPVRIDTAPPSAQRLDTSQTPEEFVSDFGHMFARSEFTAGEGLDRAHRRNAEDSDVARYWDSRGVRIVPAEGGKPQEIRLLERTEEIDEITEDWVQLAYDGTRLFATDSDDVRVSGNPEASTPTFSSENPHGGETPVAVLRLASPGNGVTYAALGVNAIRERDSAVAGSGTWTHANDLEADGVWWVAGRLIASNDNAVYEVPLGSTDAPSAITTFPTGTVVNDVLDADSAILVACSDGRVYALAPGEDGVLALAASSHFPAEVPTALGRVQSIVLVGTTQGGSKRLWRASLRGDLVLDDRQLLREWACHETLHDIVSARDSAWLLVHEHDEGGDAFAWTYDARYNAIHRSYRFTGTDPDPTGALLIGETLYAGLGGNGVHRVADTYESEGWLIGPLGDFYTAEAKPWVQALLETTVATGQEVRLSFTTMPVALQDAGAMAWVRAITATAATERLTAPLTNVQSRSLAGQVRLFAGSAGTTTPTVRSFGFRAYPRSDEQVVRLPVNVSDRIHGRGRHGAHVPRLGHRMVAALRERQGQGVLLHVLSPEIVLRGVVESVETPVLAMSRRGSRTWVSLVTVRGSWASLSSALSTTGHTGTTPTGMPPPTGGVT